MTTHSEMPRLAYLMIITRHRFSGGSETSLRLGRTATKTVGDVETVSYGYNIRSWPTRSESAKFTELMGYNTMLDGRRSMNPQFGGNISALSWKQGNSSYRGYELYYDDYGRLTDASYGEGLAFGNNGNRYDELFGYDRMGNITTLARNGKLDGSLLYGCIDDLEMEYDGNQLTRVYDNESDNDPTYEGAMQFTDNSDEDVEYEYDANGNMTKDLNSNISSVQYNCLNLPSEVTVCRELAPSPPLNTPLYENTTMRYVYNADGEKLQATPEQSHFYLAGGSALPSGVQLRDGGMRADSVAEAGARGRDGGVMPPVLDLSTRYCGNVIFERGSLKMLLTDEGYVTFTSGGTPVYHYYLRDHLGNVRVVFTGGFLGVIEQRNDYYPSGALMASSTDGSVQPYKYNGKELERTAGLDLYDYGARWMDSKIGGRFTTMDPLCEKYYDISPYAYCAGNPVNLIDTDGREWTYVKDPYGNIIINVALNFSISGNWTEEQISEYKNAISSQFNNMLYEASGGTVFGTITFYDGNSSIIQSLSLDAYNDNTFGGHTVYFASSVNLYGKNGGVRALSSVATDAIHEMLHTLRLGHPFVVTQAADTELLRIDSENYTSTPSTDENIVNNIMSYPMIRVDGKSGNNQSHLTNGQLNFMLNEINLQNRGYGFYNYNNALSDEENARNLQEYYYNYWNNWPGIPVKNQ